MNHQPDIATEEQATRPALLAMDLPTMQAMLTEAGFPAFRAKQLYHWVFAKGVREWDAMGNLPQAMRQWLADHTRLGGGEMTEVTGPEGKTRKLLIKLADGRVVESVLMRDEETGRTSACVSSQVGCAMGCTFCLTGYGGYQRNLTVDEIVDQILWIRRRLLTAEESIQHIVFMGMGEPLHNLENVIPAIRLLTDAEGIGHSKRRITVSTVGMVNGIEAFGAAELGVGLAVSLNATTDEVRDEIMPVNRRWPIAALLEALENYPLEQRRRITIEYVLMKDVNDTPEDARRLVKLVSCLRCKVNLIMYNKCEELPYEPVEEATLHMFATHLSRAHITSAVRWSKGRDIKAACGQLAAHAKARAEAS